MFNLKGKTVLIGITAGIAAYKICELIRMFKREGANVKVIATPNSLHFVTKVTIENLSNNPLEIDGFKNKRYNPEHISLADEADVFVIAPASANTISKIATGVADNLLTSIACAYKKPIVFAPAMNCGMWANPAVQENIATLAKRGHVFVEPENGFLACGYIGNGRLAGLDKIFDAAMQFLQKKLAGQKIVVTAGGTREKIDSVRYLSNYSSGKMGTALADVAHLQGADVVLITTNPLDKPYKTILVNSALDMQNAVAQEFTDEGYLVMTAAVADFRAKEVCDNKIKKTQDEELTLTLVKNPDILKQVCQNKKQGQVIVGFCAESENLEEFAKEKIVQKGCDYLVANDISRADIGFGSDENEVIILDNALNIEKIEKTSKINIAKKILEKIIENKK